MQTCKQASVRDAQTTATKPLRVAALWPDLLRPQPV